MPARFQCVAFGPVWSWRLLGSNHRELARSASPFAGLDEATADALATAVLAVTAPIEVTLAPDGTWHWTLTADDVRRAASTTGYARRLECVRAVERFRSSAPAAEVSPTPLIHRRPFGQAAPLDRPLSPGRSRPRR